MADDLAVGDAYIGLALPGVGRAWEAVTPRPVPDLTARLRFWQVTHGSKLPLRIHVTTPDVVEVPPRCEWRRRSEMQKQKEFCENFDGFDDVCKCRHPQDAQRWRRNRLAAIAVREPIPVAVTASRSAYKSYRLLKHLLQAPGAQQMDIVMHSSDENGALRALCDLYEIPFRSHTMQNESWSPTQKISTFTKASIRTTFDMFPDATKVIVLEDDLVLSPDIFLYFQRTSQILDEDESVYAVSAYHGASLPSFGPNVGALLRGTDCPRYGWMVKKDILSVWKPDEVKDDWDAYLTAWSRQESVHVVFPELSRSLHLGQGGVHVDGASQVLHHNRIIANNVLHYSLDVHQVYKEEFGRRLRRSVLRGERVQLTPSLLATLMQEGSLGCKNISQEGLRGEQQSENYAEGDKALVLYIKEDLRDFFIVMNGLYGLEEMYISKDYFGAWRLKVHGRRLIIVACPLSPLCSLRGKASPLRPLSEEVATASSLIGTLRALRLVSSPFRIRVGSRCEWGRRDGLPGAVEGISTVGVSLRDLELRAALKVPLIDRCRGGLDSEEDGPRGSLAYYYICAEEEECLISEASLIDRLMALIKRNITSDDLFGNRDVARTRMWMTKNDFIKA